MDTPTVRKSKSGDQLVVGDWLAPEELTDGAAEVLHTLAYPGGDGTHVHLVMREQGKVMPVVDVVGGNTTFELATDAELAGLREQAERTKRIADFRAFADWLEARPWAPVPSSLHAMVHLHSDDAVARVRQFGEDANVKVDDHLDDRTEAKVPLLSVDYSVIAWHRGGRPAEPKRCVDSLHIPTPGATCHVCLTDGMQYGEQADDPTGLNYGRGDEGQDPTPTGRRIPPHFESGVDARPVEADHNCGPGCPSPCSLDDDDPRGWQ